MKQLTVTLLLSVALLAGCSSPTTDAKKKEEQTGQTLVAENAAPRPETRSRPTRNEPLPSRRLSWPMRCRPVLRALP